MNFSFVIVTSGQYPELVDRVIDSIEAQRIPKYQIVVLGGDDPHRKRVTFVPFDESQKKAHITKKKNIGTEYAKYDNIVYLHDYISLLPGWYEGMKRFGDDWYVCMTKVLNVDGTRYRDWVVDPTVDTSAQIGENAGRNRLLPYSAALNSIQYISGAYWIAKKGVMTEFPLNEDLVWGEGEDIEWSQRVREKYPFSLNDGSAVSLLRPKFKSFEMLSDWECARLEEAE